MPYYLTSLVAANRGRSPAGWDSQGGANWILLDSDEALLWLPSAIVDARLARLGDDADETLAAATRTRLNQLTADRTYRGSDTLGDTIVGLLRNAPTGRWGVLRPSKVRQRYEVWLGPGGPGRNLLYSEFAVAGPSSKVFNDTFDRANGNLTGTTSSDGKFAWLDVDVGGNSWDILTNQASATTSDGFRTCRANADLDTDDHYSQGAITCTYGNNAAIGFLVRFVSTASAGYGGEIGNIGGNFRRTYRYDTDANVASDTNAPATTGTLRIECDGSSITAKLNGTTFLGPTTNTAFAGQLRTGISAYSNETGNTLIIDNFEAGDLAVDLPKKPLLHRQAVRRAATY